MRLRARHAELGVLVAGEAQAHPEGGRGLAVDGVRVGEDDLGGHAVAVEFLQPLSGVPAALEAFLVVVEPLLGEGLVADAQPGGLRSAGVALAEELVELGVEAGIQVGPVLLRGEARVTVGGDDQVRVFGRVFS